MTAQIILQQDPSLSSGSDAITVPAAPGGLDAYEQQQAIGRGGYAVVYKGRRKSDGQLVAIKRVDIADMAPKKRDRCIKEVHLLQQLEHPHVITMFDAFIDQNQLIIITEWAPGGDLKRLIRRVAEAGKALNESDIWKYFMQITDGLRGLHAARILHRDMKPANVLVCTAGVLKLGDLGLGRKLGPQTVDVMSKVGTPYYVSPEVVKGIKYDFKSDMWSLGCLLYELAMLKSPFETEGANLYDVFSKITKGDYQPLSADRFSPALRAMVSSLLAQDPQRRPTADQVWQQGQQVMKQVADYQRQQKQKVLLQQEQQRPGSAQMQMQQDDVQQRDAVQQPQRQRIRQRRGSQNRGQQAAFSGDVGVMSEHLLSTLRVIEHETSDSSRGSQLSGSPSKRSGSKDQQATAYSILPCLRCLHPLFFSQPLTAFVRGPGSYLPQLLHEEQAQQMQLGAVVQVASWLARLNKKLDVAQALDAELCPQCSADRNGSNRSSSNAPRPCKDCLRAAEAVRQAAGALGVQDIEATAAVEIAVGHGRAVCGILQAMADMTMVQLQLACRRPQAAAAAGTADQHIEELIDDELEAAADISAAVGGRALQPDRLQHSDEAAAVDLLLTKHQQVSAACQQLSAVVDVGSKALITPQVDVLAWQAEAERVGPQLVHIHLPAAADVSAGLSQDWLRHWQTTQLLQQQLGELAGQVEHQLSAVQQRVSGDLERLKRSEEKLNLQFASPLGRYADLRQQVDRVLQQKAEREQVISTGQQQLQQVCSLTEDVQQQIAERTEDLSGSIVLQRQKTAVQSLSEEIQQMERRLGMLMHQLTVCKQRRC